VSAHGIAKLGEPGAGFPLEADDLRHDGVRSHLGLADASVEGGELPLPIGDRLDDGVDVPTGTSRDRGDEVRDLRAELRASASSCTSSAAELLARSSSLPRNRFIASAITSSVSTCWPM
jgi:hypothetical protein